MIYDPHRPVSTTNGKSRILSLDKALQPEGSKAHPKCVPAVVFNAFVGSVIEYTDGLAKAIDAEREERRKLEARLDAAGIYTPPDDPLSDGV